MNAIWKVLSLLLALVAGALLTLNACADDDDDDDDNDDDGGDDDDDDDGEGLCYANCQEGCITDSACLSGFTSELECLAWAEQQCASDGCDIEDYELVLGCDTCGDCPDAPGWY